MYIDKRLQVSARQAVTANAASTDVIDLGQDRDVGVGRPMWFVVASRAAPGGTAPTLQIAIQTDDNSGFASAATLVQTAALAAADLALGKQVVIPMTLTNERYLRLNYTVGGTTPVYDIDAWLTDQEPTGWTPQADAI